ncbi:uncharacterized protein LOC131634505 [Vicia villosa]|uniref:uncharacterized protein LOC131634505 n=1 Tax=Vicia villosa TaxID=3911 RepID=UPI00273BCF1C|nr:uncharacterized protein LOC131634505 [Vicia villosa]
MANPTYLDFTTNTANPYYLHPNENPSLILVTPLLDHTNYNSWSRAMKVALISKNKLRFVDGTFLPPATGHALSDSWLRCNNMKNVEKRFSQGDIFKISDLQDELTYLHQGSLDVSTYFIKLTSLWKQIDSFRLTRDCTCDIPCTCGAASDLRNSKEQDRVIKFLKVLTESFSTVRSQILLTDPLPYLDKTFSMVLGVERRISKPSPTDSSVMAMTFHPSIDPGGARGSNSYRGRGRSNLGHGSSLGRVCTHYGRTNHTINTCFIKHGYPPGYNYKTQKPSINNTTLSTHVEQPSDSHESPHSLAIIQAQYNQIMQLLQESSPLTSLTPETALPNINFVSTSLDGKPHVFWVIDTSATHYITPTLNNFVYYSYVSPINMKLPNSNIVLTNIARTICLSKHLTLNNVYYIPTFNVNLISASKLIDSSFCHLTFTNDKCFILRTNSKTPIGLADRHGDLYVLVAQASFSTTPSPFTCNYV